MQEDELLERLTAMFLGARGSARIDDGGGVLADGADVLGEGRANELRGEIRGISARHTEAADAAQAEFAEGTRPTVSALEAIMKEQQDVLYERQRVIEVEHAARRAEAFNEYKAAVASPAQARDLALKRAQARLDRKKARIGAEFSKRVARARARAVLGLEEEGPL